MRDQKKAGVLLSYFNTVLNMGISVFFTPFLISALGDSEYGLYRIIQSFAGQLVIMTFGMSTLVSRNIVYYNALKQKKEKENFLAMALIVTFVLVAVLLFIGGAMYMSVDSIFAHAFSPEEINTAKKLCALFVATVAVTIINDCFAGMVTGHERFAVSNGIKTINRILRIVILVILLNCGCKSVAIVATDLALMVLVLLFNIFFGMGKLGERIKYHYLDKAMLKTSLLFSSAIFLQTVINQVNHNLDSFILGVMTDTKTVTMYSLALTIYTAYSGITTVVSGVFTPHATKMIVSGATGEDLTNLVSRTGRYQLMTAGAVIAGFVLFGQNFIKIWVGDAYLAAYGVTLILIIPMTVPLIQSVTNAILDAQMKRMSRSLILTAMAAINILLSVLLIHILGYIGAAFGTAISVIIGHWIIMNIYLKKVIKLNIFKMFKDIFRGLLPCILVSFLPGLPLAIFLPDTPLMFIVKITVFLLLYAILVYKLGMNEAERATFKRMAGKLHLIKNTASVENIEKN